MDLKKVPKVCFGGSLVRPVYVRKLVQSFVSLFLSVFNGES